MLQFLESRKAAYSCGSTEKLSQAAQEAPGKPSRLVARTVRCCSAGGAQLRGARRQLLLVLAGSMLQNHSARAALGDHHKLVAPGVGDGAVLAWILGRAGRGSGWWPQDQVRAALLSRAARWSSAP